MIKKIKQGFISKINNNYDFKKKILWLLDLYNKYFPFFIGYVTRIPAYLLHILNSKIIAKPGILSFKGGAFNPGALLLDENNILLIAKAQFLPWFKAHGNNSKYYMLGNPIVFLLDNRINTKESYVINDIIGYPQNFDFALEDFRVFQWKGLKMINHSYVINDKIKGFNNQKEVRSALSVFDEKERKIIFRAFPTLDFPVQNFEKNWIYQEKGSQLLLFYSLNPYKVLTIENEENFHFKTLINKDLGSNITNPGGFGTMVSYSTNPIDYNEKFWFVVIHQIEHKFTGRCYYHWGLLIDKSSFLPVKITSKPIFSGMGARGRLPGIRYISSVLKVENELLFFAGEGDVYITVTKKTIQELNNLFIEV